MFDSLVGGQAAWFGVPALVGTGVFALRLLAMVTIGHGGHTDLPTDHPGDLHAHPDSTSAFKALSFQGVMAFAMGFGWGGLAALNGWHWSVPSSMAAGLGAGVGMVWLLGLLLKGVHDLQSSGNIRINDAIGQMGDVYLTVPPMGQGRGQVRVVVNERQRIYNAESAGEAAPTNTRVRVVGVNDNTLTVLPA